MKPQAVCLVIFIVLLSGAAAGTPVIQRDPQSTYVPDSSETAMTQSDLVRAMVPVDDATFWTIMLVERKEEQESTQDFLLSLKEDLGRLIPDWLRHLRDNDASQPSRGDQELRQENAKAISELSDILDTNKVPESEMLNAPLMEVAQSSKPQVGNGPQKQSEKASGADKVPLSNLFLRKGLPGMLQGGVSFSKVYGGFGPTLSNAENGDKDGKKDARRASSRLESITRWFHNLWIFLTGFYTYMALGIFLMVYLLVRYLVQRPRIG